MLLHSVSWFVHLSVAFVYCIETAKDIFDILKALIESIALQRKWELNLPPRLKSVVTLPC